MRQNARMKGPLRIIFPLTILLLWTMFGIGLANDTWTPTQWLMLLLGHLCCLVIFIQFIYVFNYGYGLALAVIGLALLVLLPSLAAALVAVPAVAFGLRMISFTHQRYQAGSYAESLQRQNAASEAMPLPAKVMLWVFVSWLMSFELMPLFYVAQHGVLTPWVMGGALLMMAGLTIEAVADRQKQAAKLRDPSAFVTSGLFALARHPNYLGEIVFQVGLLIACLGSVSGWWQTLVAILAPGYIIILMAYSSLDLDRQQASRYGTDPAYQSYRKRTGRLLPGF
jgi:steroid 5-alpha reductase family enzyme